MNQACYTWNARSNRSGSKRGRWRYKGQSARSKPGSQRSRRPRFCWNYLWSSLQRRPNDFVRTWKQAGSSTMRCLPILTQEKPSPPSPTRNGKVQNCACEPRWSRSNNVRMRGNRSPKASASPEPERVGSKVLGVLNKSSRRHREARSVERGTRTPPLDWGVSEATGGKYVTNSIPKIGMSLRKQARSVQPRHPMAQAARCGCSVGSVMAPAHASSVCRSAALALKARQESGRCAEPNKPTQPWRGEMSEAAASDTLHSPVKGPERGNEAWSLSWTNTRSH